MMDQGWKHNRRSGQIVARVDRANYHPPSTPSIRSIDKELTLKAEKKVEHLGMRQLDELVQALDHKAETIGLSPEEKAEEIAAKARKIQIEAQSRMTK